MALSQTSFHQALVLGGALALAGGLYALPKGIVKPKQNRSELNQSAARSATRDGAEAGEGEKAEASSGPRPAATATVGAQSAAAPHTQATAEQRRALDEQLAQYRAAPAAGRPAMAMNLAARYAAVQRFDSVGYYLTTVAQAQPSEKAWQRAADAYYQAFSFATTPERRELLGKEARDLYDKVLADNPNNLDAKTNLGMAYMSSENPVKGITLLREVLEQDPRNQKVLYNLGILAIQSNQYDRAAERLGQLVQINPNSVEGQFYLGVSLARLRRVAPAEAAFDKAKSLSNDPALAASIEEEMAKLRR
ncbi:tetratricopeptide repeat protein [Hymenobacter sp. RP-2-7]|uniref:Tetratricopeptide repeat protein n=1 Tax=Hymenobacter polaris TaxID=2682546 RepID=A0A7Y0FNE7_9BACT|nr:tetratricopeptide repeat protein [Hymenobacter polaris]NML66389.1 tetratricopeptide repeat protein [Hymenobacter polaris]